MASTTILDSGLPGNSQNPRSDGRDRPHDPLDPGPYGSAGWYPDKRTGRHRRGELPDPPSEEAPRRPRPGRAGDEPPERPARPRKRFREDDNEDRYDFGKLREEAWTRFIAGSQELHHAHLVARTTIVDRWTAFLVALRDFLFRVLGIDSPRAEVETPTAQLTRVAVPAPAPVRVATSPASTPFQGTHRTSHISPYPTRWERHFDERQSFREAVVL